MKIAFTGSRNLYGSDYGKVQEVIDALPEDTEVITGACVGVDALVARLATQRGLRVHTVVPALKHHIDIQWRDFCTTFEELEPSEDAFRVRNQRMVDLCDQLIAFPVHAEKDPSQKRSGTWMTVRIARKVNKSCENDIHVLREH